jgi:hypothetical protein
LILISYFYLSFIFFLQLLYIVILFFCFVFNFNRRQPIASILRNSVYACYYVILSIILRLTYKVAYCIYLYYLQINFYFVGFINYISYIYSKPIHRRHLLLTIFNRTKLFILYPCVLLFLNNLILLCVDRKYQFLVIHCFCYYLYTKCNLSCCTYFRPLSDFLFESSLLDDFVFCAFIILAIITHIFRF